MKRWKEEKGVALIWTAIVIVVLVAFIGLAVDFGLMVWTGQQLQIAADGAALAGAQFVREDQDLARDQAQLVGAANVAGGVNIQLDRNDGNAADGDIVIGRYDRDERTFDPEGFPNAVKVNARRTSDSQNGPLPLHFARILGFNETEMQRSAIAMIGGGTGTGLLILDSDAECALTIRGNPTIELGGGAIQVNSTDPCGTCLQGSPDINASGFNMVGDACLTGVTEDEVPPLNPNSPPIPDPLADLPEPAFNPANSLGTITGKGTTTWTPGYYAGGIDLSGGTHTLEPGIYILGGKGIDIRGNANLIADGVMFFVDAGPVNINGTGDILIRPLDPDVHTSIPEAGIYENIAIFQARDNFSEGLVNGTANNIFEGTYYFPQNKINLGGTANQFGDQFIAWQAELFGNGLIELAVDGSIPAPGGRVFLVE